MQGFRSSYSPWVWIRNLEGHTAASQEDSRVTESSGRRSFVPDAELLERIAAGEESLRSLGRELGVAHTTLGRWRRRPEVASELRAVQQRLRARHAKERRAEKDLRRRARQQAARDRELGARRGTPQRRRSEVEAWLDSRSEPRGLTSQDRVSRNDELAAQTVAAGGGVQELIEATGLPTRLAVYESIDPQLVNRRSRMMIGARREIGMAAGTLRRLVPDPALITRRAAGEPLRRLAEDYGVSPSTLSRFFARPEVAEELRLQQLKLQEQRADEADPDDQRDVAMLADHYASKISDIWCPATGGELTSGAWRHQEGEIRLEVAGCCDEAVQELVRWLKIHRAVLPTGAVFTPAGNAPANATVPPA